MFVIVMVMVAMAMVYGRDWVYGSACGTGNGCVVFAVVIVIVPVVMSGDAE